MSDIRGDVSNSKEQTIFLDNAVEKSREDTIEIRFDAVLQALGEKWPDVYNELGWDKSWASKVRRGKVIPPDWQRIQLAKRLKCDTSVLWKIPDIISAYELEVNNGKQ